MQKIILKAKSTIYRTEEKLIDSYKHCATWMRTNDRANNRIVLDNQRRKGEWGTGEGVRLVRIRELEFLFSTETPTRRRQRARLNFLHCHRC